MTRTIDFDQEALAPIKDIEPLLADPHISEIMIDGYQRIYVEKKGRFEDVDSPFRDNAQVMALIKAIFHLVGRTPDESTPLMDARLSDGTLVNVVLPPVSLVGPVLTLRKFETPPLTFDDLLGFGSLTEPMLEFLQACVAGRLNIIVAGGVGSGKTTILNLIAGLIDDNERIVTVEQVAQLQLNKKRLITLEGRPPNALGEGEVSVRDLVLNAANMRADRIIVGELSGGEVLDLLQLMNMGHDGSMASIHANSVRDTLARLETLTTFSDASIPLLSIRKIMASAIDIIVQQLRLPDGSRKIVKISEVAGWQGDAIQINDIFEFRQTGHTEGKIIGHATATGQIPRVLERLQAANVTVPLSLFTPS